MADAKHEADRFGAPEVTPEHILLALLLDSALIASIKERFHAEEVRAALDLSVIGIFQQLGCADAAATSTTEL